MSYLFVGAVAYIFLYSICAILSCFSKKIWRKNDQRCLWFFLICLVFVSYFVVPDNTTDLSRYHAVANWYKLGKVGIYSATVKSISASSSTLYIHVLLLYLVSKIDNNNLLQVIWCSITYGFLAIIIQRLTKRYRIPNNCVYASLLLFFGLVSYFTCVSNLRYPCLCVLFFFAVYMKLFENKNYPMVWVSIVGLGMHLSIFMLLLIWGVYLLGQKTNLYKLVVFWAVLVNGLIAVLAKIPIARLQFVSEKLFYYFNIYDEKLSIRLRIVFISLQLLILIGLALIKKYRWTQLDEKFRKYFLFLECVLLFSIGTIFNETMLKRTMILLGPCLIPYSWMIFSTFKKKNYIAGIYIFYGIGLIALSLVSLRTFFAFSV